MKNFIFYISISIMIGCNSSSKQKYQPIVDSNSANEEMAQTALQTLQNKCYLCHHPSLSEQNRVGPPMAAIKARYLKDTSTKEEFVAAIWNFVEEPSEEKAKLRGAVKRFGVMPYQKYSQEEIEAIAAYMYDYQIEEPDWFKSHWEERNGDEYQQRGKKLAFGEVQSKDYASIGMQYAKSTKAQLGQNLMGAMQKEGVIHALEFCNVQAMPITDSMATVHQATIKRVSDLNRNPNNKANAIELAHVTTFKTTLAQGEEPTPIVEETENTVHFYYPIVTNDMCLKCHGTPNQQMEPKTYEKILELYPADKAIGYEVNEVRGIWSIEFDKNEK